MSHRSTFECMFVPSTVAVVGATPREGSVAFTLLRNLIQGHFPGNIYAINPKHEQILGLHCYKSIGTLPEKIDLAVIITPAPTVPERHPRMH